MYKVDGLQTQKASGGGALWSLYGDVLVYKTESKNGMDFWDMSLLKSSDLPPVKMLYFTLAFSFVT